MCSNLSEVFAQKNYSVKSGAVQKVGKKKKKNRSFRRSTVNSFPKKFNEVVDSNGFYDARFNKLKEKEKIMRLLVHEPNEINDCGAYLRFLPTFLIEKFGLNKYEDFSKLSLEIVDKSMNKFLRIKGGFYGKKGFVVFYPVLDSRLDLFNAPVIISDGSKRKTANASVDPGFEFESGKNYVINFYRNGNFDHGSRIVSCEVVGELYDSSMEGNGIYYAVAHPNVSNEDYHGL